MKISAVLNDVTVLKIDTLAAQMNCSRTKALIFIIDAYFNNDAANRIKELENDLNWLRNEYSKMTTIMLPKPTLLQIIRTKLKRK